MSYNVGIHLDPTQCYLEMSRAVFTSIPAHQFEAESDDDIFTAIIFSLTSVTIIYSYLAIESCINYHLYKIWEKRDTDSKVAKRFRNKKISEIMTKTKAGLYVKVAEGILQYLYEQARMTPPKWIHRNILFRFRGVELLEDDNITKTGE